MSNCSDIGLQGSSPRDARLQQFIANGPGIAGYKLSINPEEDGDAFAASFDPFLRPEETNQCFTRWDDDGVELSLEALAAESGFELADHYILDADDEDAEEISDLPPKYLVKRPEGIISTYRSAEVTAQVNTGRRQGSPRFNTASICRKAVEAAKLVSKALVAEEKAQKTATAAKPEPIKGNGWPTLAAPPVGKFLKGTIVDQGPKGLLVDIGNGLTVRVPIADERGHGSWDSAARWVLGFKPGTKVRIRVIRTNGHMEAILSDRHPRPWWRKKEVNEQIEARPV